MHRGRLWTMRMFAGFGSAEETNARFKYLLSQGQTGLSIAYDLPTLYGYDSDDPEAAGEFGKCGVAVSSLKDMEILLDGIPLDKVTTSMTINSPAAIIWAMYIAAAEKQGVPMDQLGGTIQNDILKEYIAQKEFIFPPAPSMRLVTDTIEFGSRHLPRWNTISISGYHIREAGSTRRKSWPLRWPTGWNTSGGRWRASWILTTLARASPSSSTRTMISLKR
jgi:methylmalonyl-CoA mutase N-terminal domain/subunit